ncbi:NAD(P)/FAD-dependent oxidoreductase [Aquabacter sp. CN5-332]|uniref:NAD(P)/FAD-dependent oxidoreductase n=1 Tax=Aquabacter sp. CN5-332 TaxID=3156608 RepID=UPI0032B45C1B
MDLDTTNDDGVFDCLIIGGGVAGLTAATYLGRFRRRTIVIDAGESRAKWIPVTRNCPGFPDGVTGPYLLERLRQQAVKYGAVLLDDTVHDLCRAENAFTAIASFPIRARSVVMATGIVDALPDSPDVPAMLKAGTLRLCPICDGYEVIDKRVAVMGTLEAAAKKALSMRTYSRDVTVLATDAATDPDLRTQLTNAGIQLAVCATDPIRPDGTRASVTLANGRTLTFDTIYPAMGCTIRSTLAIGLGAECDDAGNLIVDSHQRTAIPGLYAAGDVVNEINQIAVAFGHAAIAASDIHNFLQASDRAEMISPAARIPAL